jgi:hypothetical protein
MAGRIGHGEGSWRLVFFPISLRVETHLPKVFYEALATRLNEVVRGELKPPSAGADPAAHYEDQCRWLLDIAIAKKIPVLIIVDGIDEALGDRFDAKWFPRGGGSLLRLLVSARLQIGDEDAQGWVQRLGWTTGVRVQTRNLPLLEYDDVRDLLLRAGAPVEMLAARAEVIQKLYELTSGEPLLLRYYVEDLWKRGDEAGRLTVEALNNFKPGFEEYFRNWLARRQHDVWEEEKVQYDSPTLNTYLVVLACAYGRLTAEELGEVAGRLHDIPVSFRAESALRPLRRFVIGTDRRSHDGTAGYILSHPKLGEFLCEEYFDKHQVKHSRQAFVDWGHDVLNRLNGGTLCPKKVPLYLLQYLARHFESVKAPASDFMPLAEEGWLRAWQNFEGGYRGFAHDIETAYKIATQTDTDSRLHLGFRQRCQLIRSSIFSLADTPPLLLDLCVRFGVVSRTEALFRARNLADPAERAQALAFLAISGPPEAREAGIQEALGVVRSIDDEFVRADGLKRVLVTVPDLSPRLVAAALDVTVTLSPGNGSTRSGALEALAPRLGGGDLKAAALAAEEIVHPRERSFARLCVDIRRLGLADLLPSERTDHARVLLDEIARLEWGFVRARFLILISPHLDGDLVARVIDIARTGTWKDYASVLAALLKHEKELSISLDEEVTSAKQESTIFEFTEFLEALLPYLPKHLQRQAASASSLMISYPRNWENTVYRALRIAIVVPYLPKQEADAVIAAALKILSAKDNFHTRERCRAIKLLAPNLSENHLDPGLRRCSELPIREAGSGTRYVELRAYALHALVQKFEKSKPEVLSSALKASLHEAERIGDVEERAEALAALVPFIPEPVSDDRSRKILAAGDVPESATRFKLVAALARHMPKDRRDRFFDMKQLLIEAAKLRHEFTRNEAVAALISQLPGDLIEQAYTVATEIAVNLDARALAAMVPYVDGNDRKIAIDRALDAAISAGAELYDICFQTLHAIAPYLRSDQVSIAQELAESLASDMPGAKTAIDRLLAVSRPDGSEDSGRELSEGYSDCEPLGETRKPVNALLAEVENWAYQKRPYVFRDLAEHALAAERATGEHTIAEVVRVICDIGSWWP